MDNVNSEYVTRPVRPLPDFVEIIRSTMSDEPTGPTGRPAMLIHPITRRVVPCDGSPEGLNGFEAIRAADRQLADQALAAERRALDRARQVELRLRGLIFEATMVARDLRGLMLLFEAATEKELDGEADAGELSAATAIVIDCARTMAARLDALEVRADEFQPGDRP